MTGIPLDPHSVLPLGVSVSPCLKAIYLFLICSNPFQIETFRANSAQVPSVQTMGEVLNRGISLANDILLNTRGDIGK